MKSGLLWRNEERMTLGDNINRAASQYAGKFGWRPDTVFVNPQDAALYDLAELATFTKMDVQTGRTIIRKHIWLGISNPTPTLEQLAQFEQARQTASATQTARVATIVNLISGAETDGTDAQDNRHEQPSI